MINKVALIFYFSPCFETHKTVMYFFFNGPFVKIMLEKTENRYTYYLLLRKGRFLSSGGASVVQLVGWMVGWSVLAKML